MHLLHGNSACQIIAAARSDYGLGNNPDSCVFPFGVCEGVSKRAAARQAVALFTDNGARQGRVVGVGGGGCAGCREAVP